MNESEIYEDDDVMDYRDKPGEQTVKATLIAYAVCTAIGLAAGIAIGMKIT